MPISVQVSREGVWPVAPSVPEEQPEIHEISVIVDDEQAGAPIPISVEEKSETRTLESVQHRIVAYEMPKAQTYSIQYAPVRIAHDVVAVPIGYAVSLSSISTKLIVLAVGLLKVLKTMQLLKPRKPKKKIWVKENRWTKENSPWSRMMDQKRPMWDLNSAILMTLNDKLNSFLQRNP